MIPTLPTPTDTANKMLLAKENIMQIITNPRYKTYQEELDTLQSFIEGEVTINDAQKAVASIAKQTTSP